MRQYWTAPELWPNSAFVVIGGGPSLTPGQIEACRNRTWRGSKVRLIAVNNQYKLAPDADVLYFCDDKWWGWHGKKLADWKGLIVRLDGGHGDFKDPRIKVMRNYNTTGLSELRDGLHTGRNSGFQAMNLAVHLGAKLIVLLGLDMRAPLVNGMPKSHWDGDHPGGTAPNVYDQMLPNFPSLIEPLRKRGIEVVNATPGSALRCFPMKPIEEALADTAAVAA